MCTFDFKIKISGSVLCELLILKKQLHIENVLFKDLYHTVNGFKYQLLLMNFIVSYSLWPELWWKVCEKKNVCVKEISDVKERIYLNSIFYVNRSLLNQHSADLKKT